MKLWKPILIGALLAGVLDLVYAYTHFWLILHRDPLSIVQGIATGLVGGNAVSQGDIGMAALGVFLEFVLTAIMAAVYIYPAKWITDLRKYWWVLGPCYGVCVMLVMYYVVLPLSAAHGNGYLPDGRIILENCAPAQNGTVAIGSCTGTDHQLLWGTIFAHCIMVGLPIACAARYFWPGEEGAAGAGSGGASGAP